ncbi:TPA: Mph(E) family macrolide 2'-phosphotransferase [Klebsiella pneumoniae]|nr:Mph(E) family macrolide 2'-phosphotransferase [Klebsiella pneumoniae]
MTIQDIKSLAEAHGLLLTDKMNFNEMGIDFKVVFALDTKGQQWLLRIPRRDGMREQIKKEKRILELVKKHLSVEVPDWRISSTELVAYPILKDNPVLNLDAETYEITWNMDKDSPKYITSLAKTLFEIHSIPEKEVRENDLKIMKPSDLRPEIANNLQLVKSEIGISEQLETRYRKWLDNDVLWADFTQFIHGDLYAGHVLASKDGAVSGVIDWSTAHIDDPAIDFAGHVTLFGEESLKTLIIEYEKLGGKVWNKLYEQTLERAAASPLMYGLFALETQNESLIVGAKAQLGVI